MADLTNGMGVRIIGTLELVPGCALIQPGSVKKCGKNRFRFEYEGETEVFWDDQKTQRRRGERLFVDENYDVWRESQLLLAASGDDEHGAEETAR
jgi:hypothetical protein